MRLLVVLLIGVAFFGTGCAGSHESFNPQKKYAPEQLKHDYTIFRNILEDVHPSLYWYTTRDSLDYYFDNGYARLNDSMTEMQFRSLLSYTIAKIHCGHTATKYSKNFSRYLDSAKLNMFPLSFKLIGDTTVVNINLNRKDSILKRGTVITRVNNVGIRELEDSLKLYISSDGYNETALNQTLSNSFVFAGWYRNVYGLTPNFSIHYLDSTGSEKQITVPAYNPSSDTIFRRASRTKTPSQKPSRRDRKKNELYNSRYIEIDTTLRTAYMQLNSFSSGNKLRSFFRRSFKAMRKVNVQHLVIDVRNNGGGNVVHSTHLTQLLINKKFKLADSLYAIRKGSQYGKYMKQRIFIWPFMSLVTHKKSDGFYHRGLFERHYFKPKNKNHFDGKVYVITGGNSFSATSLFAQVIKGQENVMMIGEETGGGSYGNTSWYIPDVSLPVTGIRFSLPRFRQVISKDNPKNGQGVQPDVYVNYTPYAISRGVDVKVEFVRRMIMDQVQHAAK